LFLHFFILGNIFKVKVGTISPNSQYSFTLIQARINMLCSLQFQKPMSNKVFSAGVFGRHATPLKTPVRYRVYTNDARISPQGAECVLWNEVAGTFV